MSKAENRMMRRRLRSAYLSTVISISLVLLLVGVAALLLVNAKGVSDYFKEHMQISVLMKPEISDAQTLEYQVVLDSMRFVHSTEFISKAQGTREMEQMLGEGFLDIFEASPIPASVNVRLRAEYVSPDSLDIVRSEILSSPIVDEVEYQQSLIEALNSNLRKISLILGILIVLLLFISFVLINNTVRLNVFARRFTIHTMKLVGATRSFIREGLWEKVYNSLRPGDYVLIEFGHNDICSITDPKERGVIAATADTCHVYKMEKDGRFEVVYSFGWYLKKMIDDTREKGATPILVSLTPRNEWPGGRVERRNDSYGRWYREVVDATGVDFLDLHNLSADALDHEFAVKRLPKNKEKAKARIAKIKELCGNRYFKKDHTHASKAGARLNAQSVARGLREMKSPLAAYLLNP